MSSFSKIAGDEHLEDLDNRLNNIFDKIPKNKSEFISADDLTGDVVDSIITDTDQNEVAQLFDSVSIPYERIQRYGVYNELNRAIPIIKRILRVYVTNILQKNPVDGKCIIYKEQMKDDVDKQKIKTVKEFSSQIVQQFKIIYKLKNRIVPLMLLYGDSFIEVIDIKKRTKDFKFKDLDLNQSLIESKTLLNEVTLFNNTKNKNSKKLDSFYERFADILVEADLEVVPDEEADKNFSDILLRIHKPHNIISLTNNYGTNIGYLEVNQTNFNNNTTDINQMMSQTVGKLTQNTSATSGLSQNQILNKIIFYTLKKILEKTKASENTSLDNEGIIKNLDPDVYDFLKRMVIEQGLDDKSKNKKFHKLNVKFISSKNMINFQIPSSDKFPYGESIVEPLVFPGKLYILSQLSNVITKLSRAALVRKWTIDTGSTRMQTGQIQKLKRELYNTRVSVEDLSSFKSIPKILSDYKDMYLLAQNGQKFLDVEVQSLGDPSIKIADLEDARREIISLSGVPAPFLGYMDKQYVPFNSNVNRKIFLIQGNSKQVML